VSGGDSEVVSRPDAGLTLDKQWISLGFSLDTADPSSRPTVPSLSVGHNIMALVSMVWFLGRSSASSRLRRPLCGSVRATEREGN
jgi:hypothetical protein